MWKHEQQPLWKCLQPTEVIATAAITIIVKCLSRKGVEEIPTILPMSSTWPRQYPYPRACPTRRNMSGSIMKDRRICWIGYVGTIHTFRLYHRRRRRRRRSPIPPLFEESSRHLPRQYMAILIPICYRYKSPHPTVDYRPTRIPSIEWRD